MIPTIILAFILCMVSIYTQASSRKAEGSVPRLLAMTGSSNKAGTLAKGSASWIAFGSLGAEKNMNFLAPAGKLESLQKMFSRSLGRWATLFANRALSEEQIAYK